MSFFVCLNLLVGHQFCLLSRSTLCFSKGRSQRGQILSNEVIMQVSQSWFHVCTQNCQGTCATAVMSIYLDELFMNVFKQLCQRNLCGIATTRLSVGVRYEFCIEAGLERRHGFQGNEHQCSKSAYVVQHNVMLSGRAKCVFLAVKRF